MYEDKARTVKISTRFDRWIEYQCYKDRQTRDQLFARALQEWHKACAVVDAGCPGISTNDSTP